MLIDRDFFRSACRTVIGESEGLLDEVAEEAAWVVGLLRHVFEERLRPACPRVFERSKGTLGTTYIRCGEPSDWDCASGYCAEHCAKHCGCFHDDPDGDEDEAEPTIFVDDVVAGDGVKSKSWPS